MIRKLALVLTLVLMAMLAAAPAAMAGKPVKGTMDLAFNVDWPGYQTEVPDWVGTLAGDGKPFDSHPETSPTLFFEEIWQVYKEPAFALDSNGSLVILDGDPVVLLAGEDRGLATLMDCKYSMSGTVEVATGPFAGLVGRSIHMSAAITLCSPAECAPGTFRIT